MNEKLNIIHNLLAEHKFTIISEINEDLKCVICNGILINAHQVSCGCHFCKICINNHTSSGFKNCPGDTNECKTEELSNISVDYRINKRISNLIVRCPRPNCSHQCRLIEIEDHMRLCSTRNVNCPFNNVGCEDQEMNIDKLNDHMLSEIVNHNKILIDIIGNLRNEVRELKEKEEINRKEIKILKYNDVKKNAKLELLMKEINLIKEEKEDLADQMNICDRNLWQSFDKIDIKLKEKCANDSIELLKKEELVQQIESLEKRFDEKSNSEIKLRFSEMIKEFSEDLNQVNKYLNMRDDGELRWQIGKISEIDWINSQIFCNKHNPYRMRLGLWNANNQLEITLFIHSGEFDDNLKWPCQATIIISIYSYQESLNTISITESVVVPKPANDSHEYSNEIIFSHSNLIKSKHFNKNCLLICKVKFD